MVAKNAPRKPRKPRVTPSTVDFAVLDVQDETLPLKGTRASVVDKTPVPGWLQTSYETNQAKSVTLPHDQAEALVSMLRTAANRARLGVKIVTDNQGNGNTRVRFQGKARRAYTPRTK